MGASDNSGWSRYTYANLMQGGYPHAVHLVNRRGEPVHGQSSRSTWSRVRHSGSCGTGPGGLTLVVGLGGIWVEVLADSAVRALPVTPGEVREMLTELKSFPLLTGARGAEPVDLDEPGPLAFRLLIGRPRAPRPAG